MERHRIRWDRRGWSALTGLLLLACCVGSAQAAGMDAVIGISPGAMSPRATVRSYGARLQETALGAYVADSMRAGSGTEIAIECGGHLVDSLPGGSLTRADAKEVFAEDLQVAVVEVTAGQLFDLLEYAVGSAGLDEAERLDEETGSDCFPQISGFSFEFDVSQLAGRRLRWVMLDDGTVLRREDTRGLTAALPMDMLDGTLGFSMLDGMSYRTVGTQSQLLIEYIQGQGTVEILSTGRISMLGSADQTLYETLHVQGFLPYVILLILLFRIPKLVREWRTKERETLEH